MQTQANAAAIDQCCDIDMYAQCQISVCVWTHCLDSVWPKQGHLISHEQHPSSVMPHAYKEQKKVYY